MDLNKNAFYSILFIIFSLISYSSSAQCIVTVINASSDTISHCHDMIPDVDSFNNTGNLNTNYMYIITDNNNFIVDTTIVTNTYDFENLGLGEYYVYGFHYAGPLFLTIGNNVNTIFATGCFQISSNFIVVYNDEPPGISDAGMDQVICTGNQATLSATPDTIGVGEWIPINNTATIQNPLQPTTLVTGLSSGIYLFEWKIESGACTPSRDTVQITVDSIPIANAGADIILCGQNTFMFNGNSNGTATGMWSQISGPTVNIPNPLDSHAVVPFINLGVYLFEWSISDGPCVSTDTMKVTVSGAINVNAGPDIQTCSVSDLNLDGNPPNSGTGNWTQVSGPPATIFNPSDPNSLVTGLVIGTYDFEWTINDGLCSGSDTVRWVFTSPPLGGVANITPVSVAGAMDGTIEVCVINGTPPFTLSVIPFAGTVTSTTIPNCPNGYLINNLPGGTYDILIADVNNCEDTLENIMVYEPDCNLFTISMALVSNVSCYGANDGQISVVTQGGLQPITFDVGNGVPPLTLNSNNHTFTNLLPGNYPTITVSDAAGCVATYPFNISIAEPGQIQLAAIPTDVTGPGINDGIIDLCVIGGVWPYTVSLSPNVGNAINLGQQSCNLNYQYINLPAGVYSVTVVDAFGCTEIISNIIVSSPSCNLQIDSINVVNVSCNGGSDGSISIFASGANFYKYSIDGGATFTNLTPSSSYFAGQLPSSVNSIVVRDNAFCQYTYPNNPVIINDPPPITVTSTITDATGVGNDGSILLCVNGGVPGYTVNYTSTTNGSGTLTSIAGPCIGNYVLTNLTPDVFDFFIEDSNGCTDTLLNQVVNGVNCSTFNITQIIGNDVKCNGDSSGTINIVIAGGTPPYQYQINGLTVVTSASTSETLSGLPVGSYTISIVDAQSCSKSQIITINEPFLLTTTVIPVNPNTVGANDGEICITPAGGTAPYLVTASCGAVLSGPGAGCSGAYHISNLPAGTCYITTVDQNNCMVIDTVILSSPSCVNFSILSVNLGEITCNGAADGTISIVTNGGVSPFSYSIDGGISFQSNVTNSYTFTNLSPGSYNVIVRDGVSCQINYTANPIVITEPSVLTASVVGVNPSAGGNDGEICISPIGGVAPYVVTASCGPVQVGPGSSCTGSSFSVQNLSSGTCYLSITDDNNCTYLDTVTLYTADCSSFALVSVVVNDISCNGFVDGSITINASGGTPPYYYSKDNGSTFAITTNSSFTFSNLTQGPYSIVITDDGTCQDTFPTNPVNIIEPDALSIGGNTLGSCSESNTGRIDITALGGTPPFSYLWSNGSTTEDQTGLSTGTYDVTVCDANLCCDIKSYNISQLGVVTVDAGPDLSIFSDESANVGVQINVQPPFDVLWTPATGVSDPIGSIVELTPQETTTYTIEVISKEGCVGTDELTVNVTQRGTFAIPSGFTPNGDGSNETFKPIVLGANQLQYFRIFNRWGELIHNDTNAWDGSYNGKAQPVGTYIYVVEYRDENGETFIEKGHFSLLR